MPLILAQGRITVIFGLDIGAPLETASPASQDSNLQGPQSENVKFWPVYQGFSDIFRA